jgi:hypothetical protein
VLTQPGAPAAGTLNAEHHLTTASEHLGPVLQLVVAGRRCWEDQLSEHLTEIIERRGIVALLVRVDPDCNHRVLLIVDAIGDVETAGQSCVE